MKKVYSLYSDEDQKQLLAMAYSEEQIEEESQYYTDGCWFEYDLENDSIMLNEKPYSKKIKFPKTPKEWIRYRDDNNKQYKWIK